MGVINSVCWLVRRLDEPHDTQAAHDSGGGRKLGFGGVALPAPPRPGPLLPPPRRPGGCRPPSLRPAPCGQPPAAAPCLPTGSGAASCQAVRSPHRGRPGPGPGPVAALCRTGGPASCAALVPAPAQPTPRAARTPGRCAAPRGAARCPGMQATPSECPAPRGPRRYTPLWAILVSPPRPPLL